MTLDRKLIRLRKEKGLSQAELAERLDISRQAVSRWENGVAIPSTENLKYLSKLYDVSFEYMLDDSIEEIWEEKKTIPKQPNEDTPIIKRKSKRVVYIIGIGIGLLICCIAIIFALTEKRQKNIELDDIKGEVMPITEDNFNLIW